MPRPKPPEPLKPRQVRLSDTQWIAFKALGGGDWLRSRITKLNMVGIAKRQRNRAIRKAHALGVPMADIGKKFNVDRSTVWRVINEA